MKLLSIGEAARILRVHTDTLKRWEHSGKVRPRRDHRGTRFYSSEDVERLRLWREPKPAVNGRAKGENQS
jgi:excisionase family DNA binding protein